VVRIALILASIANIAAGLGLGGLWFKFRNDPGMPIVVLFVAISLMASTLMTTQATIGLIYAAQSPEFGAPHQTRTGER
jgi:hypothetical protein